jgi:ketosteroid isomerase-like protein
MVPYRTLLLALLLPLGSGPRAIDDRDVIKQLRQAQNAAISRKDYAVIAQRWTEDVTIRAGLGKAISGRQAYRDAFMADSAMTYERTPDNIVVSSQWPLAYERGHWKGAVRGAPGTTLSGEYSAQWVKKGDTWLIRSELFVATACTGQSCQWPASIP